MHLQTDSPYPFPPRPLLTPPSPSHSPSSTHRVNGKSNFFLSDRTRERDGHHTAPTATLPTHPLGASQPRLGPKPRIEAERGRRPLYLHRLSIQGEGDGGLRVYGRVGWTLHCIPHGGRGCGGRIREGAALCYVVCAEHF